MNRRALLSARPGSPRLSTFTGYTAFTETTDLSGLSAFTGAGLEEVAPHLYVLRSDTLDAVRLDIVVGAGQGHQDKLLQALFTNRLLREGTRHHTSAELAEKLDYYGAWLELTVSVHHSYLTLYTLKRYACETFALVGEMLHEPLFPEERLRIISANNKSQYLVNRQRADVIARRLFNRAVYGDNHPCGRFAEKKDFDAITRDDLLRFFTTYYRPDNCNIYLAGNVDDNLIEAAKKSLSLTPSQGGETLAEAQLSFGQNTLSLTSPSLGGGRGEALSQEEGTLAEAQLSFGQNTPSLTSPSLGGGRGEALIHHLPSAVQASIRMGGLLMDVASDDYYRMRVVTTILGGYFGSRLMKSIREDKGYTYSISADMLTNTRQVLFVVSSEALADKGEVIADEVRQHCRRLAEERVPDDELTMVRNYMIGEICRNYEGAFSLIDAYIYIHTLGLPLEHISRTIDTVRSIDAETIRQTAAQWLDADRFHTVIVAP